MHMSPSIIQPASTCTAAAAQINHVYRTLSYNHTHFLDPHEEDYRDKLSERFRIDYACFKYAVASILSPKSIFEVGVGSGISAIAFASACPNVEYMGMDSGEWEKRLNHPFLDAVAAKLSALKVKHLIVRGDSQDVNRFPESDFVHIDGDHSTEATRHDVVSAWRSNTPWILIDDAKDPAVCAGVFLALKHELNRGSVDWAYFDDTWSGNILIRTDHRRGE